ncbi:MAG: hypothetical protein Unbinned585contig1001_23 [Prokaryotic dsDNA virus sp.]|nr:MAG: hypothetical protein Unbinned585contig1001_23 [Prokaryotic dsDNA virus sp.]|tara:strand:+ start:3268 stop:3405 length:138 start_codon:yes stop_codon:yes gene_type:complete
MATRKKCICGQTNNSEGFCDGSHSNVCEDDLDQNEDVPFADEIKQ